jgi:hypothetical protein
MAYSVRSTDGRTYVGVFDFPDSLAHEIDWHPHILQAAMKSLVREIKAVLLERGKRTKVFIAADHGHILQSSGIPVYIRDSHDVGYRSACVEKMVEGQDAVHLFQIKADTLGHNLPGWCVFPKPGYYLRPDAAYRGRPGAGYRHGGISVSEVFVPLACLRHRAASTRITLTPSVVGTVSVGQLSEIRVAVSSDGVITGPIRIFADTDEIDALILAGISSTPKVLLLPYVPISPGRRKICFTAALAGTDGQEMSQASLEVTVRPAEIKEDPAVTKLKKLFGDI